MKFRNYHYGAVPKWVESVLAFVPWNQTLDSICPKGTFGQRQCSEAHTVASHLQPSFQQLGKLSTTVQKGILGAHRNTHSVLEKSESRERSGSVGRSVKVNWECSCQGSGRKHSISGGFEANYTFQSVPKEMETKRKLPVFQIKIFSWTIRYMVISYSNTQRLT